MLFKAVRKLFGTRNERLVRQFSEQNSRINAFEDSLKGLSDTALQDKTPDFRRRVEAGENLDALLPEAFATVREASSRTTGMRHFDVQMIGGMALHHGKIAEMRTGEGKTLVATLPAYLNALTGNGVHIVTVNDYLAKRDAEWMGGIFRFLGLDVGVILSEDRDNKHEAYGCDITYGTNNEFGFDYLRDNMVYDVQDRAMRGLHYAIVDEVDSILIDEARTPLIISGQANENPENYIRVDKIIPMLERVVGDEKDANRQGDFIVNEKERSVTLTEQGHERVEKLLAREGILPAGGSLYDPAHQVLLHHVSSGLRAHHLFIRDQQYVVQNNEVVIVDEFTGRLMPGRRWSDGLHQAVEAKENCPLQSENQTLASITFQNFFRMYQKLSGMTGTADTEAFEFQQIYELETMVIPTHRKMVRKDYPDRIYANTDAKYKAIYAEVKECYQKGQPVLVGTTSIENSERLSVYFNKEKIPHQVLNAKQHEREAKVIIEAGLPGAVTIATNMAGRGTDIVLGGNIDKYLEDIRHDDTISDAEREQKILKEKEKWQQRHDQVLGSGGLRIIGSERHESRRIDNQLRGRSGRQGDAGESRFYLSLEDPIMRIFAGDRLKWIMNRLKVPEDEPIEHNMVSRSLETAQRRVEQHNFDARKQLLEFDDVANEQRKILYQQRADILEGENTLELIEEMIEGKAEVFCMDSIPPDSALENWDLHGLTQTLTDQWRLSLPIPKWLEDDPNIADHKIVKNVQQAALQSFRDKFSSIPSDLLLPFSRRMLLSIVDHYWRVHLTTLDNLRHGIFLRSHAQKDPRQEFKREAFSLFEYMLNVVQTETAQRFMIMEVGEQEQAEAPAPEIENIQYNHPAQKNFEENNEENLYNPSEGAPPPKGNTLRRSLPKVGRNDPCPCGSGKKYKHCHGKID